MADAKDIGISVEVVKTGMSQDKNGYYLRLGLHPSDDIAPIVTAPIGTRYLCVFVELDGQDQPVQQTDQKAVQSAGMLCAEPSFQVWLFKHHMAEAMSEAHAIDAVYKHCMIQSRKELATNQSARQKWAQLKQAYLDSLKL